jgi:CheY-like chemotaxis protein
MTAKTKGLLLRKASSEIALGRERMLHLVLLDMLLPQMTGPDVLKALKITRRRMLFRSWSLAVSHKRKSLSAAAGCR